MARLPDRVHQEDVQSGTSGPTAHESLVVPARAVTVSQALVEVLVEVGVTHAFGVLGGAIAAFCAEIAGSPIQLATFCHETGAGFAAIELSLASERPVVVFGTTGPGITNLLTSMSAARWEGAKVIFVTGYTPPARRGRWPVQETSGSTAAVGDLFSAGPIFHYASVVEDGAELAVVASRLAVGLSRANGFVAHLGLPTNVQTSRASLPARVTFSSLRPPACGDDDILACAELLAAEPFVIWAGFGARHAAGALRSLAERAGARVMCTPRAKGVLPESHPLYLGVTGQGGHANPEHHIRTRRPARALVLGSRLGEFSSFWSDGLVPPQGFVHVDLDPVAFGAAYPSVPTLGIIAEISAFLDGLLAAWPQRAAPRLPAQIAQLAVRAPALRDGPCVRPSFLMGAIQRVVVDESDAIVLADNGNAIGWGNHYLRFQSAPRYRVSSGFTSMGHAAAGVIGASLAHNGKAVALVGDGAMLMTNEINTAVALKADAVWIVLNDARYGMVAQGMEALGWTPFGAEFPRANFFAVARGLGADGVRVEREADVEPALRAAMAARGPFVVDVVIDPDEVAPSGRNASLRTQGIGARGSVA